LAGEQAVEWLEAQRRLLNLEATLLSRPLAFSPERDSEVEQARFPNMVSLYWGLRPGRHLRQLLDGTGWLPTRGSARHRL
jgi:hypothetical protein